MTTQSPSASFNARPARHTALAFTLVLALFAITACSEEQKIGEVEPYPPPNPLIYEIANADGEVEGWLLGTIHALPKGVFWRTVAIEEVTERSDLLLVEVADLGASDDVADTFAELSYTPGLDPIDQRLNPALQSQLELMLASSDFSASSFVDVEDWASAIMLAQIDAPGEPRFGVDRAIISEFEGRPVRGFETARSQLGIFDTLAADDQRTLLEGTIKEWASSRENPGRLLRAWIAGDVGPLEKATTDGIMADPELRDALLVNRNKDWVTQLLPVLATDQKPLVAVGTAHLVGADGLPAMLEQHGYTAKRVIAP
ncbi:MAG: TraB/GumN family protein [Erythrobacter sp.]|uniref:TraB/GumN family protein n=1 Tax=Erythrobacter sp. TaxID=1042 RepID=UPI0032979892